MSSGVERLEAQGGKEWDHGSDYDAVKSILVRFDDGGIKSVKFLYLKGKQIRSMIGDVNQQLSNEYGDPIEIKHPSEYLASVEGWYDAKSNVIQGILFEVKGKETPNQIIGKGTGTKFTLQVDGKKIIGFHGFTSGGYLNSIGAYFAPTVRVLAAGVDAGAPWDDGDVFDGVRSLSVSQDEIGITMVTFVYGKGDKDETREHGKWTAGECDDDFVLDYPSEYITSVECIYDKVNGSQAEIMIRLRFKTNKRTSRPYGIEGGITKTLEVEDGNKIIGFYGNTGDRHLHKLGVRFRPITI